MEVLWSRALALRSSPTTVAVTADALVVAERHTRLVRLDPGSGALLWEHRVEDCWGTTVIAGDRCLYLSQRGVLHCLDLGSGRRLWATPGLPFHRYVSVSGGAVVIGGWRGYRALTRVDLTDGGAVPYDPPRGKGERLAWPLPLRPAPGADPAVLVGSGERPALWLLDTRTGAVLETWALPAPVCFGDGGEAFGLGDDGRVVFLAGRRTVMALRPGGGVEELWRHGRDLPALMPLLHNGRLVLVEDAGATVVDLVGGGSTEIVALPPGVVCAPVPVPGGVLFARSDGRLVAVGDAGEVRAHRRLAARVERVFAMGGSLVYAIGKGHLSALTVLPAEAAAAQLRPRG